MVEEAREKVVLVIEDDEDINDLICGAMADAGYSVRKAMNTSDAMESIHESYPDLIILDIMLPDGDGLEFLNHKDIKSLIDRIPTIIVSARSDLRTKMASFTGGARRYITKPFQIDELMKEVKGVFRQREISRKVEAYRIACDPGGDYGNFPADIEGATRECMEDKLSEDDDSD